MGLPRGVLALVVATVAAFTGAAASSAIAQRQAGPMDTGRVADPKAAEADTAPTGDETTTTQQEDPDPGVGTREEPAEEVVKDPEGRTSEEVLQEPGYGNAADQSLAAKKEELARVEEQCKAEPPPISRMLATASSVSSDEHGSWGWLVLAVAGGALLVALGAFAVRIWRGGDRSKRAPRGTLETVATVVAILGGVAGLVVQFVPGVGAREVPPAEATMEVREVHPRITRGEYARKTGADVALSAVDAREVGNVVWLRIGLRGYRDRRLDLQYGLYDPGAGGALLPGTAKRVPLRLSGEDVETLFVPVWVGYPRSHKFEAEFRLLEGDAVQEMADTGEMKGSRYRYACKRPS